MERAEGQVEKRKAKQLLYDDILANRVPSEASHTDGTSTMQLKDMYLMHAEHADYHCSKFSARVSSIWTTIKDRNIRKEEDEELFAECIKNHPGLAFPTKGLFNGKDQRRKSLQKKTLQRTCILRWVRRHCMPFGGSATRIFLSKTSRTRSVKKHARQSGVTLLK
jgi:hypothetical protein